MNILNEYTNIYTYIYICIHIYLYIYSAMTSNIYHIFAFRRRSYVLKQWTLWRQKPNIFNFHVRFWILNEEFDYQVIYFADRSRRAVCESAAAGLLGFRIWILPDACLSVCLSVLSVVCCQIEVSRTGWSLVRGDGGSYRVWCVWMWSESLDNEEALALLGCRGIKK